MFGYLGRVVEGKGIGVLAERYGWNTALAAVMVCVFAGILLLSLTWSVTPQQGAMQNGKSDS